MKAKSNRQYCGYLVPDSDGKFRVTVLSIQGLSLECMSQPEFHNPQKFHRRENLKPLESRTRPISYIGMIHINNSLPPQRMHSKWSFFLQIFPASILDVLTVSPIRATVYTSLHAFSTGGNRKTIKILVFRYCGLRTGLER